MSNVSVIDIVLALCIVFSICLIVGDVCLYIKNRDSTFKYDDKGKLDIARYLHKKIKNSQVVAIFSRDLTWVDNNSPQFVTLMDKAEKKELTIFLEHDTEVSTQLASRGAVIKKYNAKVKKGFTPMVRFTILNYGVSGSKVIIGFKDGEKHVIREIDRKSHSEIYDLISDYISLLNCSTRG